MSERLFSNPKQATLLTALKTHKTIPNPFFVFLNHQAPNVCCHSCCVAISFFAVISFSYLLLQQLDRGHLDCSVRS